MKRASLDPRRWPLAFKAPALVAAFMLIVSIVMTNAVLSRLRETQERQLAAMSMIYLNGLASALIPHVLREDIWEIFDTIERGANLEGGFGRASVVVVDSKGETLAASDPRKAPVLSQQSDRDRHFEGDAVLTVDSDKARAFARKPLIYQERRIGEIYADYDIRHLLRERGEVLRTLIATNTGIALLLAAFGYWIIRRMLGPLATLSRHLDLSVSGPVQPIPQDQITASTREFRRLFVRFNAMADAVNEREAIAKELANEERLASLGRLASGMAHEINNPLGGLFNAIDTLKRHGDKPSVRSTSLNLIERGLKGIRDVVRSTLTAYRADRGPSRLAAADLDDIRLLVGPELVRHALSLDWRNMLEGELPTDASALRQVVLNLLLNAIQASPDGGQLIFLATVDAENLLLEVHDEGPGFNAETEAVLTGESQKPAPVGEGSGLGLWVTRRLLQDLRGRAIVGVSHLGGALVQVRVPLAPVEELRDVA
ncbi:sensor histidine kinase [Bosea thiooxidans]|jgi:signal transduction histidine kinase|nr:HAMP domain-containing sensor histidine kinase [Bosea sp. (in: a-proteobacteria)]